MKNPCSPVPCVIIKYIKIMSDALMMNPTYIHFFLLFFLSTQFRSTFFYIWILNYVRGVVFFFYFSTHPHEYFAVRAVSVPMSCFFFLVTLTMCILCTVPRYTFFRRQVLSFRSLIKFTQPFKNSHKKRILKIFSVHVVFEIFSGFDAHRVD